MGEPFTDRERRRILRRLDWERQHLAYSGTGRQRDGAIVRDISQDGRTCDIVYSRCLKRAIDSVILREIELQKHAEYEMEWKVYGHDRPACLPERLAALGFQPGEREAFLVLRADAAALESTDIRPADVRPILDPAGLEDYTAVVREVWREDLDPIIQRFAALLADGRRNLSVYVAYEDGEPASAGHAFFNARGRFGYFYGGNTRPAFRRRGLYKAVVAARIREAVARGVEYVCVDALPTSEPILNKLGFQEVTYTRPFEYGGVNK